MYPMERIVADELSFHKTCFRCGHCKRVLRFGVSGVGMGLHWRGVVSSEIKVDKVK